MDVLFLLLGANSLPPPMREAHIQSEVRQGSCEWPEAIRGMPGSGFEPRCPLQLRKSPKAMKKALGLFSYAGRTFSSLSHRDRRAGSRWESHMRTSSFGCPFSFARSELATKHRRATPVSGFRRKPETGALPRKRGASSAAGGAAPLSTHARSAYSIRGEAGFLRMAVVLTSSISLRFVCCQTFVHFAARPLPTETAPLGFGGDPSFVGCREAGSSLVARSGSEKVLRR